MSDDEPRRNRRGEPIDDAANARTLRLVRDYEAAHAAYFGRRWTLAEGQQEHAAAKAFRSAELRLAEDIDLNGAALIGDSVYRRHSPERVAILRHVRKLD